MVITTFLSPPEKRFSLKTNMSNLYPTPNSSNGPSKGSKPPPLAVRPGHVAFRLLCHASRIGGVIGKSGTVIKTLQQATGARIRVLDAPFNCSDRVILVVAPAFSDGGYAEVSKAQEALVKVFERILDVAAETDGAEIWDRMVSCRLVAEKTQAGAVIGKGGKVIEMIRMDTGCRIRVLNDRLPACMAPTDEIVEIEGNVSSVKKALVAVSSQLQNCPPSDRKSMMGIRPYEVFYHETFAVPHETVTNLHVDHPLQRSSGLSTLSSSSNCNASGVHSLPAEVNRFSAPEPKALQQEVTFRLLCSNDKVGSVIGKGGSIIEAIQSETGATISVGPTIAKCEDRLVTVTASENSESRYSPAQKAVELVFSRTIEAGVQDGIDMGSKNESYVIARLVILSNQVGCLLGKGGAIVSEMRKATGASIRIVDKDQVPKCASYSDQVVQISGEFSNVQDALYNVTGRLRDLVFVSRQNSAGTRSSLSRVQADTSPRGRLGDPVPLGDQSIGDVSHSPSRHSLSQRIEHLALSPNSDHPSQPGLRTPQTMRGINSRGINDVGRGLISRKGGLELVSGSKIAIPMNSTVEIVVPHNIFVSVYGENGSNLVRMRKISGAKVIVHEPHPRTRDRTVVISGTPDETQAAQSLLQAFILDGSS